MAFTPETGDIWIKRDEKSLKFQLDGNAYTLTPSATWFVAGTTIVAGQAVSIVDETWQAAVPGFTLGRVYPTDTTYAGKTVGIALTNTTVGQNVEVRTEGLYEWPVGTNKFATEDLGKIIYVTPTPDGELTTDRMAAVGDGVIATSIIEIGLVRDRDSMIVMIEADGKGFNNTQLLYTAGETIDVSGEPVLVCQDTSDGRVYKADRQKSEGKENVIGFIIKQGATSYTAGDAVLVQVSGMMEGFTTPLTPGFPVVAGIDGAISQDTSGFNYHLDKWFYVGVAYTTSSILLRIGQQGQGITDINSIGAMIAMNQATPDEDYLPCDGTYYDAVTNTQYAPLYAAIGTIYGGTGESNFRVPNLNALNPKTQIRYKTLFEFAHEFPTAPVFRVQDPANGGWIAYPADPSGFTVELPTTMLGHLATLEDIVAVIYATDNVTVRKFEVGITDYAHGAYNDRYGFQVSQPKAGGPVTFTLAPKSSNPAPGTKAGLAYLNGTTYSELNTSWYIKPVLYKTELWNRYYDITSDQKLNALYALGLRDYTFATEFGNDIITVGAGQFDRGTVAPTDSTRLNYNGNLYVNDLVATGDVVINGGDLTTAAGTATLVNTVATIVNIAGAATSLAIGGTATASISHNYSANPTTSGNTKTVNVGTGGVAGSTTNINIGSSVAGVTTINSPTLALGAGNFTMTGTIASTGARVLKGWFTELEVGNLNLTSNTISSVSGDINISPFAGSDVVIDGHWEFDGPQLTALTDNNTIITAYTGKNVTIEDVTFDGGAIGGVTTLAAATSLTVPTIYGSASTLGSLTLRGNSADLTTGQVDVASSLEASSTTVAAFTVAGGVGIAKKLYVGGDTYLNSNVYLGDAPADVITLLGTIDGMTGIKIYDVNSTLYTYSIFPGNIGADTTIYLPNVSGKYLALTSNVTGLSALADGGTNASLTASAGSVVYGTATALALTAVGSTGQILRSAGTTAPTWSTATYPDVATNAGRILRANGTNWVETTATYPATTTAYQLLISTAANVVGGLTAGADGEVLMGMTGAVPDFTATPSIGTSVTVPTIYGSATTLGNLSIQANSADLTTGQVNILSSLDASDIATAAFTVAGGVGITKDLYVGSEIFVATDVHIGGVGLSDEASGASGSMKIGVQGITGVIPTGHTMAQSADLQSMLEGIVMGGGGGKTFANITAFTTAKNAGTYFKLNEPVFILDTNRWVIVKTQSIGITEDTGGSYPAGDWYYVGEGSYHKIANTLALSGVIDSSVTTGTAPLTIASTTKVTNLNVDRIDDLHATAAVSGGGAISITANTYMLHATANQAVSISHSAADGYIHLPSGGTTDQLLKNSGTAGTGAWSTITETAGTLTVPGDLAVNGGNITSTETSVNLFSTNVTSLSLGQNSALKVDTVAGSGWEPQTLIVATNSHYPYIFQQSNGTLRLLYNNPSNNLVERIWSGTSWGSESATINASTQAACYGEVAGVLKVFYIGSSNYVYERTWTGSTWSAATTINSASSSDVSAYTRPSDGVQHLAYRRTGDGNLVERIWSGSAWGAEQVITAGVASPGPASFIEQTDLTFRVAYRRAADSYLMERIWSGSAWGAEQTLNAGTVYMSAASFAEQPDGTLRIVYQAGATTPTFCLAERIWNGSSWNAEQQISPAVTNPGAIARTTNGVLRMVYQVESNGYIYERSIPVTESRVTVNGDMILRDLALDGGDLTSTADTVSLFDNSPNLTLLRIAPNSINTKAITIGSTNSTDYVSIGSTLTSSSKTTGALRVAGGVGINGPLYGSRANFDGYVTITETTQSQGLSVNNNLASTSSATGIYSSVSNSYAGGTSGNPLKGVVTAITSSSADTLRNYTGFETSIALATGGTRGATATGVKVSMLAASNAGSQVTSAYGLWVTEGARASSNNVVTQYGIYIDNLSVAGTSYGLYTAGSTPSYIGGDLTIGALNRSFVQYGLDTKQATGIPWDERGKFKVAVTYGSPNVTATISFVGANTSFSYYINGKKFTVTATELAAYTTSAVAAEGTWFFYISSTTTNVASPVMYLTQTPWAIYAPDVLLWNFYFNATANTVTWIGEERHTAGRDIYQHARNHAQGAVYRNGLLANSYNGLTTFTTNNDNNFGRAQLAIAGGSFHDEDILNTIAHSDTAINATVATPETDWNLLVSQYLGITLTNTSTTAGTLTFATSRTFVTGQAVTVFTSADVFRGTFTINTGATGTSFVVTTVTGSNAFANGDKVVVGARIPIYYISDANQTWRKLASSDFLGVSITTSLAFTAANIASQQAAFNNATTGGFSAVTAGRYIPVYLAATNSTFEPIIAILGQAQSTNGTLTTALGESAFQFQNLAGLSKLGVQELVPFYRLAFEYNTTANFTNARLKLRDVTFINVRVTTSSGAVLGSGISSLTASQVSTDTTNFNKHLSVADTTVQAALETLDNLNATFTTALTVDTGAVTLTGNASGSTLVLPAGSLTLPAAVAGAILYGSSTTAYAEMTIGSAGQALLSGAAGAPTWTVGTLALGGNFSTTAALAITATGSTLTVGASASVAGSNTGDVTLAADHGLSLTNQVIGLGTPSSVTNVSTNSVSTATHTHAVSGLTTSNLSGTAGITNGQLANSTISGVSLGGTLATLTISSPLSGTSYNGSGAVSIGLATGYGDTQNPYASKTAKYVLAAPTGTAGAPTFRQLPITDLSATAWRTFYSDGSGVLQELTNGTSGYILQSNGATAAPSWVAAPSGGTDALTLNTVYGGHGGGTIATNAVFGDNAFTGNTTGSNSVAIGMNALQTVSGGADNTAVGYNALRNMSGSVSDCTAVGFQAGLGNSGTGAVFIGSYASGSNSVANSAVGFIAIGYEAGYAHTSGTNSVAIGYQALKAGTGGSVTAIGSQAMLVATTGTDNTALGAQALWALGTGSNTTAIGSGALMSLTGSAGNSTAVGANALVSATGAGNTAVGYNAGSAITTGSNNTLIGGYTGSAALANNIVLSDGAGTVRLQINNSGAWGVNGSGNTGSSGNVLQSNGSGAAPTWVAPSGGSALADETANDTDCYPVFAAAGGTGTVPATLYTDNTTDRLRYDASNGTLNSTILQVANAAQIQYNSTEMSFDFIIL